MLVVGATRILRPALEPLVTTGWTVTAVARTAEDLAALAVAFPGSVRPMAVDYTDVAALRAALDETPGGGPTAGEFGRQLFDDALVYAPGADDAAWEVLRARVAGRIVQLLPSAAAAPRADEAFDFAALDPPPAGPPGSSWRRVLLGWRPDRTWHSPAEISAAAVHSLSAAGDVVLGAVRPWSERPAA